jgi:long-subunit acyl-CoA synthetase (AMP-forming)
VALRGRDASISYSTLDASIRALAASLHAAGARTVALLADNGLTWALADLAALRAGLRLVPLPLFFSPQQMAHALRDAGVDCVLADINLSLPPMMAALPGITLNLPETGSGLRLLRMPAFASSRAAAIAAPTQKITYTSGTTGQPRGVCLSAAMLDGQSTALCAASGATQDDLHLSLLPLATLLENLGGLYVPLLAGATTCLLPLGEVGVRGATSFEPKRLLHQLQTHRATTLILVPQLLQGLVTAIEAGAPRPTTLRFIAVGGASLSPRLLERALRLGLPVFEGYGLSECGSVVALNVPGARQVGSVGRPLPGVTLKFAADGELHVRGRGFLGYVGDPIRSESDWVETGDIGHQDAAGFVFLSGRKKDMFVTAYGRNVAPEWVERELGLMPAIAQAAVFGEARPFNCAVLVTAAGDAEVDAALAQVNAALPDYARVSRWIRADGAFSTQNDQLTPNGRLRRKRVEAVYGARLAALYEETQTA